NPEGLLLLAAGAVLLMRKSGATGSTHAMGPRSGNSQTNGFKKAASGATEYAADVAEQAKQTVSSVATSASEYADQARRTVSEQSERVMKQAQSTFQGTIDRVLQDQPLAVALAG